MGTGERLVGFYEWLGERLSLYVRQQAWLQATPKHDKVSGRQDGTSRLQQMRADNLTPDLPDNPAPYLIEWLFEIGPVVPAGMGMASIGWRDLAAWQDVTGIELDPWEARLLRRLSAEYHVQAQKAEKPDCPAPYTAASIELNRDAVDRKVRNAFAAFAQAKRNTP